MMVFLMALGALKGRAQTTPGTPPNKIWTPVADSNDWFNGANWTQPGAPTVTNDVGIGAGGPAQIGAEQAAVARTVTLGIIQGTDGDGIVSLPNSGALPAPLVVVNSGTIQGRATGIDLEGGGTITNNAGGVIIAGPESSAIGDASVTNNPGGIIKHGTRSPSGENCAFKSKKG